MDSSFMLGVFLSEQFIFYGYILDRECCMIQPLTAKFAYLCMEAKVCFGYNPLTPYRPDSSLDLKLSKVVL